MDWWAPYLAIPFHPQRWTCWTLVRAVLRDRFDVEVPEHGGIYPAQLERVAAEVAVERAHGGWLPVRVGEEQSADVCTFLMSGVEAHVGVCVRSELILHVSEGFATRVDRIAVVTRLLKLSGVWRHPALAARAVLRGHPGQS